MIKWEATTKNGTWNGCIDNICATIILQNVCPIIANMSVSEVSDMSSNKIATFKILAHSNAELFTKATLFVNSIINIINPQDENDDLTALATEFLKREQTPNFVISLQHDLGIQLKEKVSDDMLQLETVMLRLKYHIPNYQNNENLEKCIQDYKNGIKYI